MMATSGVFILILIALISAVVFYIRQLLTYWKRCGIPHDEPCFPYGNVKGLKTTHHSRDIVKAVYQKYKHTGPFCGFFLFLKRAVIVFDLDLIKNILIKDFDNFIDCGLFHNEIDDPLTNNLLNLDGTEWKKFRMKLSPTFTPRNMKGMFSTVLEVGEELKITFDNLVANNPVIDVKDMIQRYTIDVIGTCAFGLKCKCLNNPYTEFQMIGQKAFTQPRHSSMIDGFITAFPHLAKKLRMRQIHEDVHQFYMNVVRDTIDFREKNSIKRNDYLNLLIDLKNADDGLSVEGIAAQSYSIFLAGADSSATTMSHAIFELALNQEVQDRLRAEINEQFKKNEGKLTFYSTTEMNYMDMVIKEVLRKYSVVTDLRRRCLNDYSTSNPKYVIPKGTTVIIPSDAIHHDPEFYPDPEKFDPERFSPEEMKKRHPLTWLPFGDGPRNCIGFRFGKMTMYVGLSLLLRHFKFHCCVKTPKFLVADNSSDFCQIKGDVFLRVEPIKCVG